MKKSIYVVTEKDMDGELTSHLFEDEKTCNEYWRRNRKSLLDTYGIEEKDIDKTNGKHLVTDEEDCFAIYDRIKEQEHLVEKGYLPIHTMKDIDEYLFPSGGVRRLE